MIKALIFDFAGVLANDGHVEWMRATIKDPERIEYYTALGDAVDRAEITEAEFTGQMAREVNLPIELFREQRLSSYQPREPMFGLIEKLHQRYKIALLSNFITEWIDLIFERHDLRRHFDVITVSSSLRVAKPAPEIYRITAERLQIKPEEGLFIDDRQPNVQGALTAGMPALLFTDQLRLESELRASGIEF